jgi:hypothetical protein
MQTVWKYMLQSSSELDLPKEAQILSVHEQGDNVCMWVLVDSEAEKEKRKFVVFGTGHEIPDHPMKFIGTVHIRNGALVFHIFEIIPF